MIWLLTNLQLFLPAFFKAMFFVLLYFCVVCLFYFILFLLWEHPPLLFTFLTALCGRIS